jgi:hypothetical protein
LFSVIGGAGWWATSRDYRRSECFPVTVPTHVTRVSRTHSQSARV